MESTIRYIGNLTHFSAGATAGTSYQGVREALKDHIDYITNSERKGRDSVVVNGLDWDLWRERADRLLERNGTARIASKITLALPQDLAPEAGPDFVREFFSSVPIFNEQRKIGGKRRLKKVTLPREHIGVAVHQGRGKSGFLNPHGHTVIFPRSADGFSLDCSKSELKRLHSEWKKYLESCGYSIREDEEDTKGIHYGPRLHYDQDAQAAYKNRVELARIVAARESVEKVMKGESRIDVEAMKRIPLTQILDRLGIEWKRDDKEVFFSARWRGDTRPSVSVQQIDGGRWLWHDHGTGKGGSAVDLVMVDRGMSYRDALRWIAGGAGMSISSPRPPVIPAPVQVENGKEKFRVLKESSTASGKAPELLQEHRGLGWEEFSKAGGRLLKIGWASGKEGYKIGWKNRAGGWEVKDIREGIFSGCAGTKDISFHGQESDTVLVAESLLDGLAAAKLNRIERPFVLSLNSVVLVGRAMEWIREKNPSNVLLALDNDKAGAEATATLEAGCYNAGLHGKTIFWGPGKDPCRALVAQLKEEQAAKRKRESGSTRPTWPAP